MQYQITYHQFETIDPEQILFQNNVAAIYINLSLNSYQESSL